MQSEGVVVIWDVIQMQILLNLVRSSTTTQIPRASATCGSRIISFFEDRNSRVFEVFDTHTYGIGEAAEVSTGGGELVASDEATVVVKLLLDPIVVKNS